MSRYYGGPDRRLRDTRARYTAQAIQAAHRRGETWCYACDCSMGRVKPRAVFDLTGRARALVTCPHCRAEREVPRV